MQRNIHTHTQTHYCILTAVWGLTKRSMQHCLYFYWVVVIVTRNGFLSPMLFSFPKSSQPQHFLYKLPWAFSGLYWISQARSAIWTVAFIAVCVFCLCLLVWGFVFGCLLFILWFTSTTSHLTTITAAIGSPTDVLGDQLQKSKPPKGKKWKENSGRNIKS